MATLLVAFLGSVLAAVGTGVLAARSIRSPRADLIAWALAMLGLAIALGALALGFLVGFGPTAFRAMELFGQVLAPLALCLGLTEMAGKSLPARFAARLLLPALAVIAFAVLSTDTLTPGLAFGKTWPDPTRYYETVSNKLIELGLAPVVAIFAVLTILLAAVRSRRDPAWRGATMAVLSASGAALALAIPGLVALLGANFGVTVPFGGFAFAFLCLAAAGLTLFAGMQASRFRLDLLHGGSADHYGDDGWDSEDSWAGRPDQTGEFDPRVTGGEGVYRGNGLYRDDPADDRDQPTGYLPGDYALDGRDDGYPGSYQPADPDEDYAAGASTAAAAAAAAAGLGVGSTAGPGIWQPAGGADLPGAPDRFAAPADVPAVTERDDHEAQERMFGQIAIYTLLEERVEDFDMLTERVVEQVRAREPDTLVYIVHAVPSAPLQRILYEVYRDRAAYEEHRQQPYVTKFEVDRRPYVLATNVIELGLQQAKVSPFPSISDLLDQTGVVSPDIARPARSPARPVPGQLSAGQLSAGPQRPGPQPPASQPSGRLPSGRLPSGRPVPSRPSTALPPAARSAPAQPLPGQPGYSPSGYDPPGYRQPGYVPPGYSRPEYERPGYDQPGYDQPGYDQPGYDQPGYDQPGYEPEYDQPEHEQPGYSPSGYSPSGYSPPESGGAQPGGGQPGGGQPGGGQPGGGDVGRRAPGRGQSGRDDESQRRR